MSRTLTQWLDYQQHLHVSAIDMALERVAEVWRRMGGGPPAPVVITVGGTNGKGATVAFLEAILRAAGRRVGAYTSPHLLRYNERVRVDGTDASDGSLAAAFERVEQARGEVPLTYFEFGTLAALDIFMRADLDIVLLEVGLGGRLDAVNIIDADAAAVTTVALDHMDYLGADRETIAVEKAGIFRPGRPAIVGSHDPPRSLLAVARKVGATLWRQGHEYDSEAMTAGRTTTGQEMMTGAWRWRAGETLLQLPQPGIAGPYARDNAAAALALLYALRERIVWSPRACIDGIASAQLTGRLQRLQASPEVIVDVAHNPQAAGALALWLQAAPVTGRVHAVFSALADKDIAGIVEPLASCIDDWFVCGLAEAESRGLSGAAVEARLLAALPGVKCRVHANPEEALQAARASSDQEDRIVVFGSFHMVAAALRGA